MTRAAPAWTDEETEYARINLHLKDAEFLETVGRTKQAAKAHLRYIDNPEHRAKIIARKAMRDRRTAEWLARRGTEKLRQDIPSAVLKDAIRRNSAPRSVTSWICGDPAPGQSALERRA